MGESKPSVSEIAKGLGLMFGILFVIGTASAGGGIGGLIGFGIAISVIGYLMKRAGEW